MEKSRHEFLLIVFNLFSFIYIYFSDTKIYAYKNTASIYTKMVEIQFVLRP